MSESTEPLFDSGDEEASQRIIDCNARRRNKTESADEFGNVWDWSTTPPTFVRTRGRD
jgi:hypothetical protein